MLAHWLTGRSVERTTCRSTGWRRLAGGRAGGGGRPVLQSSRDDGRNPRALRKPTASARRAAARPQQQAGKSVPVAGRSFVRKALEAPLAL